MDSEHHNPMDIAKTQPKGFFHILLKKSTLSALIQIQASPHKATKVFWWVLLFLGLAGSTYQSCLLVKAYVRFSVEEKESLVLQVPLPIPAVTICSNVLFDWESEYANEALNISGILGELNVTNVDDLDIDQSEIGHDEAMLKLAQLNDLQRMDLGLLSELFVWKGAYVDETNNESSDQNVGFIETNNLFHGNCLTVDANRYGDNSFKNEIESGYYWFAVAVQNITGFLSLHRHRSLVGTVHQSGTPPILKLENIFYIYPGDLLEIKVAQKEINRLSWPYENECVQSDNPSEQWKSLYHSEERPYFYTMEACRDSCLQNLSYTYCNCINPMLSFRGELPELEYFCFYGCNKIPSFEVVKMCGCRHSCRLLEFTYLEKRRPNALEEPILKKQFNNFMTKDIPDDELEIWNKYKESLAIVTVSTSSNYAKVVREEAATTLPDLFAAIGGMFGLWIGFSVMSFFEILDAIKVAAVSCLRRNCHFLSGRNSAVHPIKSSIEEPSYGKVYVANTKL